MVEILITSPLSSTTKNFSSTITNSQLAEKLYGLTGVEPNEMRLILTYEDSTPNKTVTGLLRNPNDQLLSIGAPVKQIDVYDLNANSVVNQIKNADANDDVLFKLSEEEYAKKSNTVLQWKKQNQFGKFDPKYIAKQKEERQLEQEIIRDLELNQRCSVRTPDQPERRGWLRFIGKIPSINEENIWCGIEFDEPTGKNDGSFKGERYFGPVGKNYGGFVKPSNVKTSKNYEPLQIDFSSDEEV